MSKLWFVLVFLFILFSLLWGELWEPEMIEFFQLNFHFPGDTTWFSDVGMVTLGFTPESSPYYVNIIAYCLGFEPHWVVRNMYIPDASWIADFQMLSKRFDLFLLGYYPGMPVEIICYCVHRSDTMFFHPPEELDTLCLPAIQWFDNAVGMLDIPDSIPTIPSFPFNFDFEPDDDVDSVQYRGCRVPNVDLDDGTHPDNPEYAGDDNACGVASATNSLRWLDEVNDEIELSMGERELLEELSALMSRYRNAGVTTAQMVRGKLDFINAHDLPIQVKFQSHFDSGDIASSDGTTIARNDNTGPYPTWQWLKQEIADSEDVEINYFWGDDHGHSVVVTGIEETEDGHRRILFKHDTDQDRPGGTVQEDGNVYIDDFGRIVIIRDGHTPAWVGSVVSESPGTPLHIGEHKITPENIAIKVYPNPFNSSCFISAPFGSVILIHNLNGKVVANLEPEDLIEKYQVIWVPDPSLASGIYFIQARAGVTLITERVVYLK
ncbi:T9SS type A sorting domain-containing protein [bacterium]|nr:T9SS type A sorting domain-containing protein [bacterium]